ncbi:outer membrane protein assembly factor BamB family protein [Rugosimonospora acidiphila]|uniref:outer membrane protein assembly factor BamB family protein n=1 Tax=Rugosimonospora acidiphila TaxID=556531 RepID=UPI0031E64541
MGAALLAMMTFVAGSPAMAAAGPAVPQRPADWSTYHGDNERSGVQNGLHPVKTALRQVTSLQLDGAVYASPVVVHGRRIVATENDSVYEFDGNRIVWQKHLGTPVPRSSLPCGNINPLGITSTPAYDPATDTLVVVAEVANPIQHIAFGLNPATGAVRWQRNVDVPGETGIDPAAMQNRAALLVLKGQLYVPYGGLAGDCSAYRGSLVRLDLRAPKTAPLAHFTVPTPREGAIWQGASGPVVEPGGDLLVGVGNGASGEDDPDGPYDFSDSVLKIDPKSMKMVDSYSPATWLQDNAADLDLGSQSPAVVGGHVFIDGKRGVAYVLNRSHLGGIGGEVSQAPLCDSFGGPAVKGSTVYVPCTDGLRAVRINGDGAMTVLWHAASTITGSPVIGAGRIWSLDTKNGILYMLDPATGASLGSVSVGAVNRFATPALYDNSVIVGTLSGVTAFSWK